MEMPATPRTSRSSNSRRWPAAVPSLVTINSILYSGCSFCAFSSPRPAMVQKSAAALVTSAMVFFCWACAAPVASASAAAVANSDTMSFFVDPFMYTSLGHPVQGFHSAYAPSFIYVANKCRRANQPDQDVLAPSSSLNSTDGTIIVNMAAENRIRLCFSGHTGISPPPLNLPDELKRQHG